MFDSYEIGLIAYAAQVDEVINVHRGIDTIDKPLLWADSFTSRIITALTEDDDELRDRAFPDWAADGGDADDEPDVDTIRDGILECITDDIECEMPDGYMSEIDPITGAPRLVTVAVGGGGG